VRTAEQIEQRKDALQAITEAVKDVPNELATEAASVYALERIQRQFGTAGAALWLHRLAATLDEPTRTEKARQAEAVAADMATGARPEVLYVADRFRRLAQELAESEENEASDVFTGALGFCLRILIENTADRETAIEWLETAAASIKKSGDEKGNDQWYN
jgi:hypothetical protein